MRKDNIQVNAILPGRIHSDSYDTPLEENRGMEDTTYDL